MQITGTHNGHYESVRVTSQDPERVTIEGTHNGRYEQVSIEQSGDTVEISGTHNGRYEHVTISDYKGRAEDLAGWLLLDAAPDED